MTNNQYDEFMEEFIDLGHMTELSEEESGRTDRYFIPPHQVVKESSVSTKCPAKCPEMFSPKLSYQ